MALSPAHILAIIALLIAILSVVPWPNFQPHWGVVVAVILLSVAVLIQ